MAAASAWGKKPSGRKFVSGSSQLVVSSVSTELALSVGRRGTYSQPVRNHSSILPPSQADVANIRAPLAPKARELIPFNNIVKVSEIELLEKLEGGVIMENDGLAIMFEADTEIEYKLTGTLKAHLSAWRQIDAGAFAISVIENGYIKKLGPMPTFYSEANNKSYREHVEFANECCHETAEIWCD